MNKLTSYWQAWSVGRRVVAATAVVVLLCGVATTALWWSHTEYKLLFSGLSDQDAGTMVAELDRLKVPYRLDPDQSLWVPAEEVGRTRLKLMSRELPLQGGVGFEVFNNADFGMTEFAQKVNYQRAMQGELTRTIQSLEAVQAARVHLVLPEQSLFRKGNGDAAKASVTLAVRAGEQLGDEQVQGIQRLVAASVPAIQASAVTVVDQRGRALSRTGDAGGEVMSSNLGPLDLKRRTEEYFLKKVHAVLNDALGPGTATAAVDVTLNLDQSRVTTEEVLAARGTGTEGAPTGVVVRERQNAHDNPPSQDASGAARPTARTESVEVDYQTGKRIEHSVVAPGAIKSLHVAVIVKGHADAGRLEQVRDLVAASVGASRPRGDVVAVHAIGRSPVATVMQDPADPAVAPTPQPSGRPAPLVPVQQPEEAWLEDVVAAPPAWWAGVAALLLVAVSLVRRRRRAGQGSLQLTLQQREQMLSNVREWLELPLEAESTPRSAP